MSRITRAPLIGDAASLISAEKRRYPLADAIVKLVEHHVVLEA